ncbi:MAG: M23 family metallopeptidase [Deltaproteobacteria bacterium]|nr:M23 family metallopeptidase [Deltaproteobacteria bacterium]TLN03386.1 MAG: M23 family metallopeptidase [bacterium]
MNTFRPLSILLIFLLLFPVAGLAQRNMPVDGGRVTSGVGWRLDPFGSGRKVYHRGIDIAVPEGTRVYPVQKGTVYYAGPYKGYGNLVAVNHGNGVLTLYGHNATLKVTAGDRVDSTTVIALSGNTGRSTGPHVHFEVRELAGYDKQRHERLAQDLKLIVEDNIHEWINDAVSGQGGSDGEMYLPPDIDE